MESKWSDSPQAPATHIVKSFFAFSAHRRYNPTQDGEPPGFSARGDPEMSRAYVIDEQVSGPNALRAKHERDHVGAGWYGNVANRLDDASREGVLSVFGRGFTEELPSSTRIDIRPIDNNTSNSGLIR